MSLAVAFTFSTVATSAAQAECGGVLPEHKCIWEIKETAGGAFEELKAEEEMNTVGSEVSTFTLTAGAKAITCTEVSILNVLLGGKPGKDFTDRLLLKGCTTTEIGCKVKSKGNTKAGEILITNLRTKLVERTKGAENNILADNFEHKTRKAVKEWVTLEFGKAEKTVEAGTRFEHKILEEACAGYVTTKVKGVIAAKVEAEKLNFPTPELSGATLEAFGVAATLAGTVKVVLEEPGEYRGS
jgi:ribosomal protein S17E